MFDLGDELTIENYRIPWLIWIQIVVLFLLIFLIYCFANLSDQPNSNFSIASSSSSQKVFNDAQKDKPLPKHNFTNRVVTNLSQNHRAAERQSIKGEIEAGTRRRVERGEVLADNEDYSGTNAYLQPCHYFRLARLAFLKCLGLDSSAENSSTLPRRKNKEQ